MDFAIGQKGEMMDDLISRQAAIDALRNINTIVRPISESDDVFLIDKAEAMTELMMLPSAQPEQKKGRWIETNIKGLDYVYCSECQDTYYPVPIDVDWYYCPHCGAKMEDEQE